MSKLDLIRAGHTEVADGQCWLCDVPWPCDTGVVLAALAAAEARAEQAEQRYQRARAETFDCYTETLRERNANAALRERAEQAERDTEAALLTVGAFRAAIEDLFSKATGESADDGFIRAYVLPVGAVHRAIGLARGTDAGGKWMAETNALRERLATVEAALSRLRRAWDLAERCSNEFEPEDMAACAEYRDELDAAILAALAATPAAVPDEDVAMILPPVMTFGKHQSLPDFDRREQRQHGGEG